MKRFIATLSILLSLFSCVDYSSNWVYLYEKPKIEEFVGEWKMIESTYKNLEEDSGLTIQRNGKLIIREDSSFMFKNMPAVIDFIGIYGPERNFSANGTYSFKKRQDYWRLNLHLKKNKEVAKDAGIIFLIKKNKENSLLRLLHMRLDESFIVFEKAE